MGVIFSIGTVQAATQSDIDPPTSPSCRAGALLWENHVDVNNLEGNAGIPVADIRMLGSRDSSFVLPIDLPSAFDGQVEINITEAIAWDGYERRPDTGNQPNERFAVLFFRNGNLVWQSPFTGVNDNNDGIATGVLNDEWIGPLGGTTLPNGADEIRLIHWGEATFGNNDRAANSVVPSSVCIEFSRPAPIEPPPAPTCPAGAILWRNNVVIDGDDVSQDVRFLGSNVTTFVLPIDLPDAFNGGSVDINITEAIAWDGYRSRPDTRNQPNERFSVVFLKDGEPAWQSPFTGVSDSDDGIDTGVVSDFWAGPLGATKLGNGADEIILVHWGDPTFGNDDRSANSVVPSSVCIEFEAEVLGRIGNRVWSDDDNDGNGQVDGDDEPLAGVVVKLLDSDGNEVATETTNANGVYNFRNLPLGTYTVMIDESTLPALKQGNPAFDPDGGGDGMSTVTLDEDNPENLAQDFAYVATPVLGSIGDYVWLDSNGNGLQDEPAANGINDITVNLLEKDGTVLATTSTTDDASGNPGFYLFDGLAVNTSYVVEFVLPQGFNFTVQDNDSSPLIDSESSQDSDADPETGRTAFITLEGPAFTTLTMPDQRNWDAGLVEKIILGSIGDQIWSDDDMDGNGVIDGDDVPLEGIVVKLLDSDGNEIATDTTNARGRYSFNDLPLGSYIVMVDENSLPDAKRGNPTFDPDGGDDGMAAVTLDEANPDNDELDFAYFAPPPILGTIGDQVWSDDDNDGNEEVDGDDVPLQGVIVKLLDSDGNEIATDTTDVDGAYLFEDLPLGTYSVMVDTSTLPDAKQSNPAFDPDGGDDNMSTVTLDETTPNDRNQDFAYTIPAPTLGSIGDQVWSDDDNDGNGLVDGDDVPLAGVVVKLLDSDGNEIATATTGLDGDSRWRR